jgi:hypothetical protein
MGQLRRLSIGFSDCRRTFAISRQVSPEPCCRSASSIGPEDAGKAGRRRHPQIRGDKNAHGVDHRCAGRPAFPARMVLTVSFVLSPGSVALLPPSPCGWLMRVPGWAAASPQALTPACGRQDHTTSPSADGLASTSGACVCPPPTIDQAAVTAPCRMRVALGLTAARPVLAQIAPALPRPPHPGPHLVTIAKRPSGRAGMARVCHKSEIRKSEIFLRRGLDRGVLPDAARTIARSSFDGVLRGCTSARGQRFGNLSPPPPLNRR